MAMLQLHEILGEHIWYQCIIKT